MDDELRYSPRQGNGTTDDSVRQVMAVMDRSESIILRLDSFMSTSRGVVQDLTELARVRQEAQYQLRLLDARLTAFIARTNADTARFNATLPVLEKQLDRIQNRIDLALDKALTLADGDFSDASVARQNYVVDLLSEMNKSFNDLVAKLMG